MKIEETNELVERSQLSSGRLLAGLWGWLFDEPKSPLEAVDDWYGYVEPPEWESGFRKAVFLDFDGVLHRGTSGTLRHREMLEQFLSQWPDLGVVVISDWRIGDSLQGLKGYFSSSFRDRVFARTGELAPCPQQRQREITDLADRLGISHYAVLDDDRELYSEAFEPLISPDPSEGITEDILATLGRRINAWDGEA